MISNGAEFLNVFLSVSVCAQLYEWWVYYYYSFSFSFSVVFSELLPFLIIVVVLFFIFYLGIIYIKYI